MESKDEGPGVEEVEAAVVALIGQVEGGRVRAGYSLLIQSLRPKRGRLLGL